MFPDIPDPGTSPLYLGIQAAVRAVAARRALPANWINDVVADALRSYGPVPRGSLWRSYGSLEILVPAMAYMLALKILAGRPMDVADARELCRTLGVLTRGEARGVVGPLHHR